MNRRSILYAIASTNAWRTGDAASADRLAAASLAATASEHKRPESAVRTVTLARGEYTIGESKNE